VVVVGVGASKRRKAEKQGLVKRQNDWARDTKESENMEKKREPKRRQIQKGKRVA